MTSTTLFEEIARRLATKAAPVWQTVVVSVAIVIMLAIISTDRIGVDWVMATTLILFMVTEIVTLKEALAGFSNTGILTVMVLFIVAEGISRTGALDYYMGMILGKPKTIAGAQLRLMVPIGIISTFLNNTPIVAVMIPLTLRWAKNTGLPRQQLLIPLSYATILGGTCSLVGTSTNLVVSGLLSEDYPGTPEGNMGIFDIALYGIPNLLIGLSYIMALSPFLLPFGRKAVNTEGDTILLGARATPWSPAAGRTVRRSGLGNSGGIYLVNVRRAATGNMVYAVSKDFVVSAGDELYFAGSVSGFSEFCEKHALEIITPGDPLTEAEAPDEIGTTLESVVSASDSKLLQIVNNFSDQIDGRSPVALGPRPARVVVTQDVNHSDGALIAGVDCIDRPGLLMEISSALFELGLKVRHSEAAVFADRSISVWRTESLGSALPEHGEVWSALSYVSRDSELPALKKKVGSRVVRAFVPKSSSLIGTKPLNITFRETFKASVLALQKNEKNVTLHAPLEVGDLLILQVLEGSPLLISPPADFYDKLEKGSKSSLFGKALGTSDSRNENEDPDLEQDQGLVSVWKDLQVEFKDDRHFDGGSDSVSKGDFLTAFVVPPNSPLENKSLQQLGYNSLPGAVLVSIERPVSNPKLAESRFGALNVDEPLSVGDVFWFSGSGESVADLQTVHGLVFYESDEIEKSTPVLQDRRLVQAVVAKGSPLVGKTVAESQFRTRYGGAIISVQRSGDRVHEHPGKVKLQTGDALLIQAGPMFVNQHRGNYETFALVTEVENSSPPRPRFFLLAVVLIITSLVVAGLEIRELLITAAIVGVCMVLLGIVTQQEARDCLQWDLYIVVASAFGIGTAMVNSGVAAGLATFFVRVGTSMNIGDAGVYGAIFLGTSLLSSILTNNAAAALMYPIAMDAVDQTGVNRLRMAITVMLASSDYMTSFGYQTNLMVCAPGGYKNADFLRFGGPLQLILFISGTAIVSTGDTWYVSWVITGILFVVVSAIRLSNGAIINAILKKDNKKPVYEAGQIEETRSLKNQGNGVSKINGNVVKTTEERPLEHQEFDA
ncbi:divalent anion Na symporter [Fragilaria crotonensis]|nr:divalent anion Na symporter [Fragilaria crotonensis]